MSSVATLSCVEGKASSATFQNCTGYPDVSKAQLTVGSTTLVPLSIFSPAIFLVKKKLIETLFYCLESLNLCNWELHGLDPCLILYPNSVKLLFSFILTIPGAVDKRGPLILFKTERVNALKLCLVRFGVL